MVQKTKSQSTGTITLNGEGEVTAKPDMATIRLGVQTIAPTAADAMRDNAEKMTRVIAKMKELGIPSADLQTSGFSVSPIVDYDDNSPTKGEIVSYRVDNSLRVNSDIDLAALVLDGGVTAGANIVGSLQFGLRDDSDLREKALEAAVRAARADADIVAFALGASIKRPKSVEVMEGNRPILLREAARKAFASTPLEEGTLNVSASVKIVYEYRLKR